MKNLFKIFNKDDFFQNVNLHIHSTISDGKVEFSELITQAQKSGLKYYSITDHNSLSGYKTLKTFPDGLITGVEFDCYFDLNLPHILGYGVDINNKELNELTAEFKSGSFELPARILSSRSPKKVIDAIHNAGGIAVLAHPCCYWCLNADRFIQKLVKMGLDGVEVYYPYDRLTRVVKFHSRKTIRKAAEKYNLLKTGGEDNHGSLSKGGKIDWERIL